MQVHVKKLDQSLEVLRFVIELVIDGSGKLKNSLRVQVLGRECVGQRRKFVLALVREHAALHHDQHLDGLLVLSRGGVMVGEVEQPRHSGTLQISRAHERVAIGIEKRRVALASREGLQQGRRANGVAGLQVGLGIEQRDAPLLRGQPVRAAQHI